MMRARNSNASRSSSHSLRHVSDTSHAPPAATNTAGSKMARMNNFISLMACGYYTTPTESVRIGAR